MNDMIEAIGIPDHEPAQLRSEKGHTCDRCLAAWSRVPFDKDNADIFKIEEEEEELQSSACKACQILGMAMRVYENEMSSLKGPFLLRWERRSDHSGVATLHDSNGIRKGESNRTGIVKIWCSGSSKADSLGEHEILERSHVDFGTIQSWLNKCNLHVECTSGVQQRPQNLRVIDCMERAVVSAPLDCQYVTLSYVWGGLVFKTNSTSGLLPTILPRTIEDGIRVTLILGYRYLWVDAFCINQDDSEDKHCQVQQMDLIYTSSVLTLIAAAGSDPSYGLPGVSNARKMEYRYTSIGKLCISFTPGIVYRDVAGSRWFTRGWTFQEGYVSRRRLYFTESGVLFICNQSQKHEDFHRYHGWDVHLLQGTLTSRVLETEIDGSRGLIEIMRLLEQYMGRRLSYETDVLNAIMGVLNYHHTINPSIATICGLPYQTWVTGRKIICVSWTHDRPATRRLGFPSWSPFGWIGPIKFLPIEDQLYLSKKDTVSFSCHVRDGCVDWNHPETSQYLQITANVHHFPMVNLVQSGSENMRGILSEHPTTRMVLHCGGAKVDYGGLNYYLRIFWDTTPPDHYDSTWVTCVVFHSHDGCEYLMIVKDCGTHYERLGFASAVGVLFFQDAIRAAGFHELASTTNGLPTLCPKKSPNFYWRENHDSKNLGWLQDTEKVTITLG